MAIQFNCPGCAQPIEVDEEFAGRTAGCPYCRQVVTVPMRSSLEATPAATARPITPPVPPASGVGATASWELPAGRPPPVPATVAGLGIDANREARRRSAATFGKYALVCTLLGLGLLGVSIGFGTVQFLQAVQEMGISSPTPEDLQAIATRMGNAGWLAAGQLGAGFFTLAGMALGIVSLTQHRTWKGVLSVVVCGFVMTCFCVAIAVNLVFMTGSGSAGG
jgi:hypothetical protein